VTRISDGEPVAGATVRYFGGATGTPVTDVDGFYQIGGIPAGDYALQADAADYGRTVWSRVGLVDVDCMRQI